MTSISPQRIAGGDITRSNTSIGKASHFLTTGEKALVDAYIFAQPGHVANRSKVGECPFFGNRVVILALNFVADKVIVTANASKILKLPLKRSSMRVAIAYKSTSGTQLAAYKSQKRRIDDHP